LGCEVFDLAYKVSSTLYPFSLASTGVASFSSSFYLFSSSSFISYLTSRLLASCAATSLSSRHSTLLSLSTPFEVSLEISNTFYVLLTPRILNILSIQSHRLGSPRCR